MANALYSPHSGYILADAVYTGTAPMATYSLDTFAYIRPNWRVKYDVKTVTVTATLGASRKAEVLALPMSNIDAGSLVLSLTNGAGLNVAVPVPAVPTGIYGRLPLTTVLDLRGLASTLTRTSNVWNLVITANSVNVTLGAAIWLGTLVEFTANFRPGLIQASKFYNGSETNFYGTENKVRSRARTRFCDLAVPSRDAQRDAFMEWGDAGEGSGLPSLFWPNPSVNDALLGSWPDEFSNTWVIANYSPMEFRFTERSKGIPLL